MRNRKNKQKPYKNRWPLGWRRRRRIPPSAVSHSHCIQKAMNQLRLLRQRRHTVSVSVVGLGTAPFWVSEWVISVYRSRYEPFIRCVRPTDSSECFRVRPNTKAAANKNTCVWRHCGRTVNSYGDREPRIGGVPRSVRRKAKTSEKTQINWLWKESKKLSNTQKTWKNRQMHFDIKT